MAHHIRHDKTCKNCGYVVEQVFCPKCGQQNVETRQSFTHLFTHFIEDFTHYDNAFWSTIKNLLFHPGRLTNIYLSGKRQKYVPPVKLYIFVSFVTFLLIAMIPDDIDEINEVPGVTSTNSVHVESEGRRQDAEGYSIFGSQRYRNLAHYDSIRSTKPASERNWIADYAGRNLLELRETKTDKQIISEFKAAFLSNLPKVIFFYLPIFAFWLWLLHNKKKWLFFDHGIFTLHYFAFMLLLFASSLLLDEAFFWLPEPVFDSFTDLNGIATFGWTFVYFFIAHKRVYGESTAISNIKSIALFGINCVILTTILFLFTMLMLFSLT